MLKQIPLILLLIVGGHFLSCSNTQRSTVASRSTSTNTSDGSKYTTAFPDQDVSKHLQEAQKSILRIVSTGSYETYLFEPDQITLSDIKTNNPADIASHFYSTDESTAGTAILLEHGNENSLLITCEHVVSFPDTLVSYYETRDTAPAKFVESISIKRRQSNLIYTPFQFQKFDIITTNAPYDLALLSAPLSDKVRALQQPLNISPGHTDNLQLGSFLYVMGFPKGYPMVTRGLASTPGNWSSRFIITDALFNPGISGGIIIASNDNFNSFEWIGMASSATANRENLLVPRPNQQFDRIIQPYHDSVFIEQKSRIAYGITQAIPINRIKQFLEENNGTLNRLGFRYRGE